MYVIKKCALVSSHSSAEGGSDPVLVLRNKDNLFSLYYVTQDGTCNVITKKDACTIWNTLTRVLHPPGPSKRKAAPPQALYALLLQKHAEDA